MQYLIALLLLFFHTSAFSQNQCAEDYSILKKSGFENHFMQFVNFAYKFQGRCRGHSLVTQKTFYLMEFERGENPHNCSLNNFPFECQQFYFEKFATVFFENEVVEIPGFKNFSEFSQVPYIEGLLRYHVSRTPTTFKTLVAHNRFLDKEENPSIAHFKEAVERVVENNKPYLAINSYWTGDHAVLAYKFKKDQDLFKLCVRDPNLIPDPSIDCENFFYIGIFRQTMPALTPDTEPVIKETEEVFYHKRGEPNDRPLLTVRLYNEEDDRINNYIQARYNYCLKLNSLK